MTSQETKSNIDWKTLFCFLWFFIMIVTVGKLSASYEGCRFLYNENRTIVLSILSILYISENSCINFFYSIR
jgi:hypothetical protein